MKKQDKKQERIEREKLAQQIADNANTIARIVTITTLKRRAFATGNARAWYLYQEARNPNSDNTDIQDCLQAAALGVLSAPVEASEKEQFTAAYRELYQYLATVEPVVVGRKGMRTVYLDDPETGEIVAVNDGIRKLVDEDDAIYVLRTILDALSPRQKEVAKLLAYGYSVRQIAAKIGVKPQTAWKHQQAIQRIAHLLFPYGLGDAENFLG